MNFGLNYIRPLPCFTHFPLSNFNTVLCNVYFLSSLCHRNEKTKESSKSTPIFNTEAFLSFIFRGGVLKSEPTVYAYIHTQIRHECMHIIIWPCVHYMLVWVFVFFACLFVKRCLCACVRAYVLYVIMHTYDYVFV